MRLYTHKINAKLLLQRFQLIMVSYQGQSGFIGAKGVKGDQGPDGQRGKQGKEGPPGPSGPKGAKGAPGYAGQTGEDGPKVRKHTESCYISRLGTKCVNTTQCYLDL